MCGIIGVVTGVNTNVSPLLIEGLKRLEYRGYDSAGIATLSEGGGIECRRSKGKLLHLQKEIELNPISGTSGIGHTRWATHGKPTKINAHPHLTSKVAVVHNGIIENFRELRSRLESWGAVLESDTDTEVIPHLVTKFLDDGMSPADAVSATIAMLSGTFALAILFAGKEQFLIATKRGSPLAIGYGEEQMYVGSDAIALAPFTSRIAYLKDGDIAYVGDREVRILDEQKSHVTRPIQLSVQSRSMTGKGGHRHYMMKEIHEQPEVISQTFRQYFDPVTKEVALPLMPFDIGKVNSITIVACGTSYYSGMICKYWLEKLTGIPVAVDIASEFRYRSAPLKKDGLAIFISQSGETADTLAALRFAKENGQHIVSIVNVVESAMAHASDVVLPIMAGAEIGVASTKAFTAQLIALLSLGIAFADKLGTLDGDVREEIIDSLEQLPALVMNILGHDKSICVLAQEIVNSRNVLYIGRGTSYPVAMEGALKLKELTYIHAEGIAAGELKHGSLALVDELLPVIAIAPSDELFEKTSSNIHEVAARGGRVIVFCDYKGAALMNDIALFTIILPECHTLLSPIIYTIPLQLLAYHVAVAKGNDIDQPRNLAKSVTVE